MPREEIETHPYLQLGQILNATKLILGSFPVYECTNDDNPLKLQHRHREGTIRFFYGSNRNSLWSKYSMYIDETITQPLNIDNIIISLTRRGIAVSDTVISCERYAYKKNKQTGEKILYPYSSGDNALHKRKWNKDIIKNLINKGTTKILCTSKGVLSDLEKKIICPAYNRLGNIHQQQSQTFQTNLINNLNGNLQLITNPIAKVFVVGNQTIQAIAIPSPGSPQRQIKEFGYQGRDWEQYVNSYFVLAFNWLKE